MSPSSFRGAAVILRAFYFAMFIAKVRQDAYLNLIFRETIRLLTSSYHHTLRYVKDLIRISHRREI